jgi:ribosomal protein S18 acetylase RimI-like enzyme
MAVKTDFQVRPAASMDQRQIASLIHSESYVHRHLDWRNPLDWIGVSPYLVAEQVTPFVPRTPAARRCETATNAPHGRVVAALACPPDPPQVAWIRLFVNSDRLPLKEAWDILWTAAQANLSRNGNARVAVIALKDWLRGLLTGSGFTLRQQIVMFERKDGMPVPEARQPGIEIRQMTIRDLPAVAAVDAAAFDPLWHNSLAALNRAYQQALLATVAESAQGLIGYQISTQNPYGAHLARLAVRPEVQGRGVGRALVSDLIQGLARRGVARLTVNTQDDNFPSLALYKRLGFVATGERYPVFEFPMQ